MFYKGVIYYMKLSKRLQTIVDFVPAGGVVGDIGTDHGYIPVYLIDSKKSKKVIGTDISKGSLDKIIQYVKLLNFENQIDTRLGNGLEVIGPNEIDTVIISGMGGLLIRDILSKDLEITNTITHFILQPNIAAKELREYLIHNNFKIVDEELVFEENKYYEIIYATKGESKIDYDIDYVISPILILKNHPILRDYINFKIKSTMGIQNDLIGKESEKSQLRYLELSKLICDYEEVLKNLKG